MLVEVVSRLGKMLVEWTAVVARHIVAMGVNPKVGWRFTFPYILGFVAKNAVAQVDAIFAFAVKAMEDG